ncbi:uncharacterized membrane protein YgaE (UPF0421/DUF939 family) [Scopulibacillus darangshiensis]|uniref:Uncharacterized membrane protein YgaE (UPF0421/DUF939 family) n=1 Tax=Scopulibacillus darangshiensis TaxID=442528 RepID=A0A4R2PCB6_9BACL|nr:aromatic acid exporter family protein [Scopulibacillus darangshiensis]TCP31575.1 uncharacterized membrane protein YgaE (UPF0421/DUF939 family) [Scopulibacillus darangshiensis]
MNTAWYHKILEFLHRTSIVWKTGLGSGISWELAKLAGTKHPFLAPITLILCLQATTKGSLTFTFKRVLGTVLGILIIVLAITYLGGQYWGITLIMLFSLAIAKMLKLDDLTIREVALSIVLVFALTHKSPEYGIDRMRDTVIGASIAVLFLLVILPKNDFNKSVKAFEHFTSQLSDYAANLSFWLKTNTFSTNTKDTGQGVKTLFNDLQKTTKQLRQSSKNLFFNIYAKDQHKELKTYMHNTKMLENGMLYLCNISQTFKDWSNSGTMTQEERVFWSDYMSQLSRYIDEWGQSQNVKKKKMMQWSLPLPVTDQASRYRMSIDNDVRKLVNNFKVGKTHQGNLT